MCLPFHPRPCRSSQEGTNLGRHPPSPASSQAWGGSGGATARASTRSPRPAPRAAPAPPPPPGGGPGRTYGVPALGEHGSGRGGAPSQRGSPGEPPPALPRLHAPESREGRSGDSRRPRGEAALSAPAAGTSSVRRVLCCCCSGERWGCPGWGGGVALRTVTAAPRSSGGTGPDGTGVSGGWWGWLRPLRRSAGANDTPFLGLASCRCDCKAGKPQTAAVTSLPTSCLFLPRAGRGGRKIQPEEVGRGVRLSVSGGTVASRRGARKSPWRAALLPGVGGGARSSERWRRREEGGRRRRKGAGGALHRRPQWEQLR